MEKFCHILELNKFDDKLIAHFPKPDSLISDNNLNDKLIECGLDLHQRRNVFNFLDTHGMTLLLQKDIEYFMDELINLENQCCWFSNPIKSQTEVAQFHGEKICRTTYGFLYRLDNKILLIFNPVLEHYQKSYRQTSKILSQMIKEDESAHLKFSYVKSRTQCIANKTNKIYRVLLVYAMSYY